MISTCPQTPHCRPREAGPRLRTLTAASARWMLATTSSLRLVSWPSWYCRWVANSWADT